MAMYAEHIPRPDPQAGADRRDALRPVGQQDPEMSVVLKRLNSEVDALESVLSELMRRLDPVLLPNAANKAQQPTVTPTVLSMLGSMVENESVRIAALCDRIHDTVLRLAV